MSPTISIDDVTQAEMALNIEEEKLLSERDKPTTKNYWDAFNPIAPAGTRPENRMAGGIMQSYLGGGMGEESAWEAEAMDPEDSVLKPLLDAASPETRAAIFEQALSTEHAIQIYNLRGVRDDAYMAIANDSLGQQLLGGALPAIASPFTIAPVSILTTSLRLGKAASIMVGIGETAALSGAAAVGDELIAGAQGMEEHKLSAAVGGVLAGGGISAFTHILSGTLGKSNAHIILKESDTWTEDFITENNFYLYTENGVPRLKLAPQGVPASKTYLQAEGSTQIERMHPTMLDKIPWINKFTQAAPIRVWMSDSAVGRTVMSKIVAPTVALFDAAKNVISIGRTGNDFKMSQAGIFGNYQKSLVDNMAAAKQDGMFTNKASFMKDMSEFYQQLSNRQSKELHYYIQAEGAKFDNSYGDALSTLQKKEALSGKPPKQRTPEEEMRAADDLHATERKKVLDKAREDFYNNYKVDWNHPTNPHIGKAAQGAQKYFNDHLATNKQLGMKGTMTTNKNKLYAPRILSHNLFDKEGMLTAETVATFKADVRRAFKAHPGNDDLLAEELDSLIEEYVAVATNIEQRMQFSHGSFLAPTLSGDARMKGRKFDMDMEIMGKYMETDLGELIGKYQYQMSGRQAVYFAFGKEAIEDTVDNNGKIISKGIMTDIMDEMMAKEGRIDATVIKDIKDTILDLSGQLRMNALSNTPGWTLTRNIQTLNSSRLLGGTGGNQLIEAVANLFFMPTRSMLKGKLGKSLKESGRLMFGDPRNTEEMAQMYINAGFLEDGLAVNHANRYADTELGFNASTSERVLAGTAESLQKWNGMKFIKTTMEHMTGGAIMVEIPRMNKILQSKGKLVGSDAARAGRWGIGDTRKLQLLTEQIEILQTSGMQAMSQEGRDLLQLAIQRGVGENVIQGNSLFIPHWMKVPTKTRVLFSQFMRFPMIAHNTLLQRGMREEKSMMAAASIASSITFMGIKYLREQAAISLGLVEERDAKFDYFAEGYRGDNAIKKGLMDSLSYIAPLGMLGTLGDYSSSIITGNEMGSDYRKNASLASMGGVTVGLGETALKLMQQPFTGAMTNERTALSLKTLMPWA
ncbi:MAG: hypothetical protein DRI37_05065, partial [Chloroflexi bacterium]